jgi:hypothetical protein
MGAFVAAGPTNSVVIDKQGMYWMAGKVRSVVASDALIMISYSHQWKNSGDGKR